MVVRTLDLSHASKSSHQGRACTGRTSNFSGMSHSDCPQTALSVGMPPFGLSGCRHAAHRSVRLELELEHLFEAVKAGHALSFRLDVREVVSSWQCES